MIRNSHNGFTLIEVLIGVALLSGLSLAVVSYLRGFSVSHTVDATVREIESVITDVRRRSVSGLEGKSWGVLFENASTTSRYSIFSGVSYASGTVERTIYLPSRLRFGVPQNNRNVEVVFASVTGFISEDVFISVIPRSNEPYVGVITISALGKTTRNLYPGLISYWRFDEGSGSSTMDSTGVNTTADSFAPLNWGAFSECKKGRCVYLNGDYLEGVLAEPRVFTAFSVMGWARLTASGNYGGIVTGLSNVKEQFDVRLQSNLQRPQFRTEIGGNLNATTTVLSLNTWYHLVYTYDGSYKRMYVNGSEVSSSSLPGFSFILDNYEIGRSEEKSSYVFYGYIDELRVFNRALDPFEIQKDYDELK